jgi:hypothetical protein
MLLVFLWVASHEQRFACGNKIEHIVACASRACDGKRSAAIRRHTVRSPGERNRARRPSRIGGIPVEGSILVKILGSASHGPTSVEANHTHKGEFPSARTAVLDRRATESVATI